MIQLQVLLIQPLDSATDMVCRIMVQMDSTRWRHYIEPRLCISPEYSRDGRYIDDLLDIARDRKYIYIYIYIFIMTGQYNIGQLRD